MAFSATTSLLHSSSTTTHPRLPASRLFSRVTPCISPHSISRLRSNAISENRTEVITPINGSALTKYPQSLEDDTENHTNKDETKELVESVRYMLKSMEDGEISISPYDTAWVALVVEVGGGGRLQFPESLEWISSNQLSDGSWGDGAAFSAHDRIINTLACVIALRYWDMHPLKCHKGIKFVRDNIHKIEDENEEHMPIGFEITLPSLIEAAKKLGIDIPNDSPGLQHIYAQRDLKLSRIPKDILHKVPTTLLHSLEGLPSPAGGLDWEKLLKLQSADGSFLFSPASTAFALNQTRDDNCLRYLSKHVTKFNGGVPNVYPVDLFEHLWAVDRLQRLGVSHYFRQEIEECVDYVYRYWTNKGICWARESEVQDIDDTAMGFRLLRLHGYDVSADVFKHFEKDGEFFCFAGQSTQAVTGMYNLYRASQLKFPGEKILEHARTFSSSFLQEKLANNEVLDKWIITKDLPGEVGYALDVPWYASLPRVETRFYIDQYGGEDDVWIGKSLYRMLYVNNNTYLELAKLDYNNCQSVHQQEWKSIQQWYRNCNVGGFRLSDRRLLLAYYIAAASVFEPEKSLERLSWARSLILMETIKSHFDGQLSSEQKHIFVSEFEHGTILMSANGIRYIIRDSLVETLLRSLDQMSMDMLVAQGIDIHQQLHDAWGIWLRTWEEGGDMGKADAELLVRTLNSSSRQSRPISEEFLAHPQYQQLLDVTTRVCSRLRLFQDLKETNGFAAKGGGITTPEIESDMQELAELVLTKSTDGIDSETRQNFLAVARSFYYAAYCNPGTIDFHMTKVLFEIVV